jgi:hypothetical protein
MGAAVRVVLASYPMWWKERYGAETAELTEDLLADDSVRYLQVLVNLAVGSALAWAHYRRPDRRPQFAGTPWGPVPDGGHRDIFGNRGLSPRSLEQLEPGETVLGVIDGWQGSPFLASYPLTLLLLIIIFSGSDLVLHAGLRYTTFQLVPLVVLLAVCLVAKIVTSSCPIAIAVTSNGLAIFRMRTFTRRSDAIVRRLPAAPPAVVRTGASRVRIDLGDGTYWVLMKSLPLIRWMGGHPGGMSEQTYPA